MTGDQDVILVDHLVASGADPLLPPEGRASVILLRPEERALIAPYRAAGFGGYLIKPLRRASLVERVTLAGKASASDDDRIARRVRHAPSAGGVRVLLAEDNPINAMLARTLLRREGAEVDHVEDGEAALQALAAGRYDLVLMDVRMPGVGGLEATRSLRARGVNTPVVAPDRQRLRGRSARLPGRRHGRLPGQAAQPRGASDGAGALDRPRLDGASGPASRSPPRGFGSRFRRPRVYGAGMTATAAAQSPSRRRRMWDVLKALGRPRVGLMLVMGLASGPAVHADRQHARVLAGGRQHQAGDHRRAVVGRAQLRLQVRLGRDGRSHPAAADWPARPPAQLDAAEPDRRRRRPDRHGPDGPEDPAGLAGGLRHRRRRRRGDPGHRDGRLADRDRRRRRRAWPAHRRLQPRLPLRP
ncbi:MAG: response regulator [Caulobacteraceae bacterium]